MSQSGTIVVRKAGTFIPNEYLEKVLAAHPKGWGAAMIQNNELMLNSGPNDGEVNLEFIQETMKAFDTDITFFFCDSPNAINTEDIPPFVLLSKVEVDGVDNAEVPQIVGFIEGNFPNYVKEKSSHPPEYHLVQDYLIPKIEGMSEMVDGDLNKITEAFQKPYFKKEMILQSVSRGTITLVAANGVSVTFAQNDLSREYPWGWVSNHHGFGEAAAAAPKKVAFPSRSTVREAAPKAEIAAAVTPAKTETSIPKNYTTKKEKPPSHLSRKDKKNWYKMKIGFCPKGWESGIPIDVYVDTAGKVMTMAEVKRLGLTAVGLPKLENPEPDKDTDTENIPHPDNKPGENENKEVSAKILPMMSAKTREHVKDIMRTEKAKKIIAENADILNDPKIVQGYESKFADFSHQLGVKSMDEFAQWDYEMMLELCRTNPDGGANMIFTFRNLWLKSKLAAPAAKEETAPVVVEKKVAFPKKSAAA